MLIIQSPFTAYRFLTVFQLIDEIFDLRELFDGHIVEQLANVGDLFGAFERSERMIFCQNRLCIGMPVE